MAVLATAGLGASATAASLAKEATFKNAHAALDSETVSTTPAAYDVNGAASWYGGRFHGRLDARGERFDENAMTAAHRTLPLNSWVSVTNLENGRHVVVRITDRGPYAHRRVIDLSRAAADALGYVEDGTTRVNVRAVSAP